MSGHELRVVYQFGDFELDATTYELTRRGERVRLARQPMDVLLLLAGKAGELVSRDEIGRCLWQEGLFVDRDAGIHSIVLKIRRALGDAGRSPQYIETVAGRGYRFINQVSRRRRHDADAVTEPPHDTPHLPRHHDLPSELTSFVGRRKELDELERLLAASRLLTLIGAGGVGKTRLAVRLATGLVDRFPHGVWMADLSPLSAPDLIAQTLASSVGVRENPYRSVRDSLIEFLRDRRLLLVVDTCEHLVDACAELTEALLRGAPGLRIVATSREALGVPGEVVYRVPSLAVPATTGESVSPDSLIAADATQLFIDRASAADPAFSVSRDNAPAVANICRRLDGIPLAIELAAARVAVLSPAQIEARLHDRFRLLTGGARTSVARQRTLEATVDWSYQLLSDVERLLLNRLGVFPASWTLEAAERVCGGDGVDPNEMLDHLCRLAEKSLVVLERDMRDSTRYRLLETVRQYARQRLLQTDDADRLHWRHFDFFFNEFRDSFTILRRERQLPRLHQLREEQENIRAALEWAITSPDLADEAVEFAGALFWFWTKRGLFEEGKLWLSRVLQLQTSRRLRPRALMGLAHMHYFQGRLDDTAACTEEALSLSREENDAWNVSFALFFQSLVAFEYGHHEEAVDRAVEARAAATDELQHGGPLLVLANIALSRGDYDSAQQLYDESVDVHRRAGEVWGMSILLAAAAGLRTVRKDFDRACAQATEAISICEQLDDPRGLAWSLEVFAGLAAAGGDGETAARLWGASNALLDRVGGSLVPTIGWIRDHYYQSTRESLGDAVFASVLAEGQAMSGSQAVALARQNVSPKESDL
jgi:predicted ATPase/DNA-binding winged helix-turn-helix (wHTH) protein